MASQLAAWQTSVAAVRAFVGEERWPQDYDAARWAQAAAALDLDKPRPSIVVLRAGDGCFAACLAHRCAADTVVALLDDRYFGGAGRASIEAPGHLDGFSAKLVARRDGAGSTARRAPEPSRHTGLVSTRGPRAWQPQARRHPARVRGYGAIRGQCGAPCSEASRLAASGRPVSWLCRWREWRVGCSRSAVCAVGGQSLRRRGDA